MLVLVIGSLRWCQCGTVGGSCNSYLHSGFAQVQSVGEVLAREHVRILRVVERAFELVQLQRREGRSTSSVFPSLLRSNFAVRTLTAAIRPLYAARDVTRARRCAFRVVIAFRVRTGCLHAAVESAIRRDVIVALL